MGNPTLPPYQSNITKANFGYGEETVVPLGSGVQGRQNSNVQMEMDQIGQY